MEMNSAINLFPDRAEPYLTLGAYLNSISKWEMGYEYLSKARTLSLDLAKSKYILFINEKAYGKYINDELSVSCYWTGRYEEGLEYLSEILNDSDFESSKDRLLDNLNHFNNRLDEKN
jgi:tetratricopeptide (TPR) repeat protein